MGKVFLKVYWDVHADQNYDNYLFDIKISLNHLIIKNLRFENFVSTKKQTKPSNHQLAQSVFFEDLTFWVGLHPKSQTGLDRVS